MLRMLAAALAALALTAGCAKEDAAVTATKEAPATAPAATVPPAQKSYRIVILDESGNTVAKGALPAVGDGETTVAMTIATQPTGVVLQNMMGKMMNCPGAAGCDSLVAAFRPASSPDTNCGGSFTCDDR